MRYLLFVFYLVLFAWLVTRVKFFTRLRIEQFTTGDTFPAESNGRHFLWMDGNILWQPGANGGYMGLSSFGDNGI
ncbi:MAG: hypothetical protein WDO71_05655 [Bacteroidota bacterium]